MSSKLSKRKKREQENQRQLKLQAKAEVKQKMCSNKKSYDTEFKAWDAGKKRHAWGRTLYQFRTYFCPHCNKYHLTKR